MTIYDIETEGSPREELEKIAPEFSAPSNYKDPQKIAEAIREKREAWFEEAALDATTGRILVIGLLFPSTGEMMVLEGDERDIIRDFWGGTRDQKLVGLCSNRFDLPFIVRRSWLHGIKVPNIMRGRYFDSERFIDLADLWSCGNREDTISLDTLAKYLGCGGKNGEGKDFARLYHEDHAAAMTYLENDLRLTAKCAKAMGVQ